MVRHIRAIALCAAALAGGAATASSCVDPAEIPACDPGQGSVAPTGKVLNGVPEGPVTPPYVVRGTIDTSTTHPSVAIDYVTVAGVMATPTTIGSTVVPNFASWSATLGKDDLETHRVGTEAKIDVIAADVCGKATTIASYKVPLGPDPVTPITGLALKITPPSGQCYLPADGSATATVEVSADPAYWGATVSVAATNGTLSPSGSTILNKNGTSDLFLTGSAKGTAVVTAASGGVATAPQTILVAAAPQLSPATGKAQREVPYSIYVLSTGHLLDCRVEPTDPATVTATISEPALGPISGVTSVKSSATDCSKPERLRVEILFAKNAPSGAQITLRCRDTYMQEGAASVTAADPTDGGT